MPATVHLSLSLSYVLRSLKAESLAEDPVQSSEAATTGDEQQRRLAFIPEYRVYNRERELERLERERKERQWEKELNTAMSQASTDENDQEQQPQIDPSRLR